MSFIGIHFKCDNTDLRYENGKAIKFFMSINTEKIKVTNSEGS